MIYVHYNCVLLFAFLSFLFKLLTDASNLCWPRFEINIMIVTFQIYNYVNHININCIVSNHI